MGGKPDVVFAFRAIEPKSTSLATSQDNHTHLAIFNQLISRLGVIGEILFTHIRLADAAVLLNDAEVDHIVYLLVTILLLLHDKVLEELVDQAHIELCALFNQTIPLVSTKGLPSIEDVALTRLSKLVPDRLLVLLG